MPSVRSVTKKALQCSVPVKECSCSGIWWVPKHCIPKYNRTQEAHIVDSWSQCWNTGDGFQDWHRSRRDSNLGSRCDSDLGRAYQMLKHVTLRKPSKILYRCNPLGVLGHFTGHLSYKAQSSMQDIHLRCQGSQQEFTRIACYNSSEFYSTIGCHLQLPEHNFGGISKSTCI